MKSAEARASNNIVRLHSEDEVAGNTGIIPPAGRKERSRRDWPAFNVERWAIGKLKPSKANARSHSEEQVAQIAASIREWGWTQPILVDTKGGVIAGHGRLAAARLLKIAEVPVIVARGWSPAQKKAYLIADNQLGLNAGWDKDLLSVAIGELSDVGFDLDLLAFPEVDRLFAPNLDPETGAAQVTADDIAKAKDGLEERFTDASAQHIVSVSCPHCGESFGLNKDSL